MKNRHKTQDTRHTTWKSVFWVAVMLLTSILIAGCSSSSANTVSTEPANRTILAAKTAKIPVIDGKLNDAAWRETTAVSIQLSPEPGVEARSINLKALSDGTNIYLSATYKDISPRKMNLAWEYDGTKWVRGSYDDTLAFVWNINDSISGFNSKGLDVMTDKLHQGSDVFDFTQTPRDAKEAAGKADFWGW